MSLPEKLMKIQALIDRTMSEGERKAAALARDRILSKQLQEPKEYHITLHSIWQKSLLKALCKKYGSTPTAIQSRNTPLLWFW